MKHYGLFLCCSNKDLRTATRQPWIRDIYDNVAASLHQVVCDDLHWAPCSFYGLIRKRFAVFFLVRLVALVHYIKNRKPIEITPRQVLLFQSNGYNINTSKSFDLVCHTDYRQLICGCTYETLIQEAASQLVQLRELLGNPAQFLVCIDEAQLWSNCVNADIVTINGNIRRGSLLSLLFSVKMDLFNHADVSSSTIACGTAYNMEHSEIHLSGTKHGEEIQQLNYLSVDLFRRSEDVIEYLRLHISLPNECEAWIFSPEFAKKYLPARIRMVAQSIRMLIEPTHETGLLRFKSAWKSTFANFKQQTREQFIRTRSTNSEWAAVLNVMEKIVLGYFLNHTSIAVPVSHDFCNGVLYSGVAHYAPIIEKEQKAISEFTVYSFERMAMHIFGEQLLGETELLVSYLARNYSI